jgi:hypothetical protein
MWLSWGTVRDAWPVFAVRTPFRKGRRSHEKREGQRFFWAPEPTVSVTDTIVFASDRGNPRACGATP